MMMGERDRSECVFVERPLWSRRYVDSRVGRYVRR